MAKAYVTEYTEHALVNQGGGMPISEEPGSVVQSVINYASAHAESAEFAASTRYIMVNVDSICSYVIGRNPTATTSSQRLPADAIIYFRVRPGDKISFVSNS